MIIKKHQTVCANRKLYRGNLHKVNKSEKKKHYKLLLQRYVQLDHFSIMYYSCYDSTDLALAFTSALNSFMNI